MPQMSGNFAFLQPEWPRCLRGGSKAEALVIPDPRTACFYARRALELAVDWLYKHDTALKLPYQDNLSALHPRADLQSRQSGEAVFSKARLINTLGNRAVHSHRAIPADGRADRRARAVPRLLLAGPHLRARQRSPRPG